MITFCYSTVRFTLNSWLRSLINVGYVRYYDVQYVKDIKFIINVNNSCNVSSQMIHMHACFQIKHGIIYTRFNNLPTHLFDRPFPHFWPLNLVTCTGGQGDHASFATDAITFDFKHKLSFQSRKLIFIKVWNKNQETRFVAIMILPEIMRWKYNKITSVQKEIHWLLFEQKISYKTMMLI